MENLCCTVIKISVCFYSLILNLSQIGGYSCYNVVVERADVFLFAVHLERNLEFVSIFRHTSIVAVCVFLKVLLEKNLFLVLTVMRYFQ